MSIAATVGVPIVTSIPACIHDGFVALEQLRDVEQTYLLYVLKSLEKTFKAAGQTGSQANLNSDIVKNTQILLPPEKEQRQITEALSSIDSLTNSLRKLIAKKQAIKQGMLHQLFTEHARNSNSSQPDRRVPLESVTTWLSGGTPNRSEEPYWQGEIPWISASSLRSTRIHDSDQRITAEAVQAGSNMAPEGAALVLVRGMALHREFRAGMATRPVAFNQDIKALVPSKSVLPDYLIYSLHAESTKILDLVSSAGSGTGVIDTNPLKRLPIWLPSLDEQKAAVRVLDDLEEELAALEQLAGKYRAVKDGMMRELLSGHTRLPL